MPFGIIELIRNDLPGLLQEQAIVHTGCVILLNGFKPLNVIHIVRDSAPCNSSALCLIHQVTSSAVALLDIDGPDLSLGPPGLVRLIHCSVTPSYPLHCNKELGGIAFVQAQSCHSSSVQISMQLAAIQGSRAYFSMPCQASSVNRSRFSVESSASVSLDDGRLLGRPFLWRREVIAS